MARIFFLFVLYFGTASTKTVGSIDSDPAPGRSPGPPIENFTNIDEEEHSHNLLLRDQKKSPIILDEISDKLILKKTQPNSHVNETNESKASTLCDPSLEKYFKKLGQHGLMEKNFISKVDDETKHYINISIKHSTFSSENSIVCGLLYEVIINSVQEVKDFYLESFSSKMKPTGSFTTKYTKKQITLPWFHLKDKKIFRGQNFSGTARGFSTPSTQSENVRSKTCLSNNVWTGERKTSSQLKELWIVDDYCEYSDQIEFRLHFSVNNKENLPVIWTKSTYINLNKDCTLWLKNISGYFDHANLPLYKNNCKIYFPKTNATSLYEDKKLLVLIKKFNVACDSGGYLQINNRSKLCGKYEEIHKSDLIQYLTVEESSYVEIHKSVLFSIEYRLVDYCYNMLLTDQNKSFKVRVNGGHLDCYFKIHLPFGNQVNLTLKINPDLQVQNYDNLELNGIKNIISLTNESHTNLSAAFDNISNQSDLISKNSNYIIDKNKYQLNLKNESNNNSCDDILLEIIEKKKLKLKKCIKQTNIKDFFLYLSSSNMLVIRISHIYNKKKSYINANSELVKEMPIIFVEYSARPIVELVQDCHFGWVAFEHFCLTLIEKELTWAESEAYCLNLGGHLTSIMSETEEEVLNEMIINSPSYQLRTAYWIGASDINFEGDFRWTDGNTFQYSKWFPGWMHYNNYNKQPNDDGLSKQDCIEIRKYFKIPPLVVSTTEPYTKTFMWNDRNCNERNSFVCKTHMLPEEFELTWINDCNKTVSLTKEHPKASIWSPEFPKAYPDNANCFTTIIAPPGFRIIIEFEEFVTENEPSCQYDYLEIIEPVHIDLEDNKANKTRFSSSYDEIKTNIDFEISKNIHKKNMLNVFSHLYETTSNYIIKTPEYPKGYAAKSQKIGDHENLLLRICGDWSSKLKLLRYNSKNLMLGLHFVTDYSNHFGGFKAKIFMENEKMKCPDERLVFYNGSCYLFGSYPEVDWWTAQQTCKGIGAELSTISSSSEHKFLIASIRNQIDYNPQIIYWLGGRINEYGKSEWMNNEKMVFEGWPSGEHFGSKNQTLGICLGLQWKIQPSIKLPSGIYWQSENCKKTGGYICKQALNNKIKNFQFQNETVTGTEGRFTSPGYPNLYPANIDYWIHLVAPEKHRIIIQFQKLDLESQSECLYDYIAIQDLDSSSKILLEPGSNLVPIAMLTSERSFEESNYDNILYYLKRIRRSTENILKSKGLFIKRLVAKTKNRKNRFRNKKSRRKKRTLKMEFTEETTINQRYVDNYKYNAQTFLPYVRWCGRHDTNMSKFDFVSLSNEVNVNFHSDHSNLGAGFAAVWKAIDLSGCPLQILTSKEGFVQSPNFPHFLMNNLDCTFMIQAPNNKRIWIIFQHYDLLEDANLYIDLGNDWFEPFKMLNHLNDGIFLSKKELVKINIKTGQKPRGKGFQILFKIDNIGKPAEERVIYLQNNTSGYLHHLNYPNNLINDIDFSQHLIAPLGNVILLEVYGFSISENKCSLNNFLEVLDNYADYNGTKWFLCDNSHASNDKDKHGTPVHITSYLNTLHIRQKSIHTSNAGLNASVRLQQDINVKLKLATGDNHVESCFPSPCLSNGKCISRKKENKCQCAGHFTGKFCALHVCELEPCVFGQCQLTSTNFKCLCQSGYTGITCEQRQKPCSDNPCEGRGECFEKNDDFFCRCHAWWEGKRCEKRMLRIPYKPLSERMLQEPFWLGLITVFVVLAFIGLVWCAKRHFPEKIEKLLAEEATRNGPAGNIHGHHHHTSLREQLQFTSGTLQSNSSNAQGAPRSIFNKLGIRKPSILSLSSPNPSGGAAARTFSLDDLLRPPTRRSSSPRKKRNNSTPVKKNVVEKKKILQHLVAPANRPSPSDVNISDIIGISDKESSIAENLDLNETTFSNSSETIATRRPLSDSKLEKKVTFARLLDKVSAEMSSGSEMDADNGTRHSSALSLHSELQFRTNSVPQSPCTNEIKSLHSSSSIQGSESASSISETAIINLNVKNNFNNKNDNRRFKPKVSSADSLLAMFKNFASSSFASEGSLLPATSITMSPSPTPTALSPHDEALGDDESSTSSQQAPVSFSIGPPDSPVFYRQTTFEVPVMDIISAHKTASNMNVLHPPTVLLEIPNNGISKCLSPIRELPTPIPSPALTPIMPRAQKYEKFLSKKIFLKGEMTESDTEEKFNIKSSPKVRNLNHFNSSENVTTHLTLTTTTSFAERKQIDNDKCNSIIPPQTKININSNSKLESKVQRPRNLIIPKLVVEQPSPTKNSLPVIIFPGTPPPGKNNIGEKSLMFPEKPQQRLFKQLDKPSSLDFPPKTPRITITSNSSDLESDADVLSPAQKNDNRSLLIPGVTVGMCYLSPFAICTRGDRTISESNLSSSGYSSMASPGPSRCGSNNPLYLNEHEDNNSGNQNSNNSFCNKISAVRQIQNIPISKEKKLGNKKPCGVVDLLRLRSDSETMSDEAFIESNDEGIGTDNIEEKNDCVEGRKAKEFEVFLENDLLQSGKNLLTCDDNSTMVQLQLPTLTVNQVIECVERGLSPVSSRSESPLSEKTTGFSKFSYHFYGRKDQQLPFTDSDGLYDFPSSDGRSSSSLQNRKANNKKRDRKSNKNLSPNLFSNTNEISSIDCAGSSQARSTNNMHHSHHNSSSTRKSPKRRTLQRSLIINSSSSTESLTSPQEFKTLKRMSPKREKPLKLSLQESIDKSDKYNIKKRKKNHLKAIGNQIRFLKRIEKSIERRKEINSGENEEIISCDEIRKEQQRKQLYKLSDSINDKSRQDFIMTLMKLQNRTLRNSGYSSY